MNGERSSITAFDSMKGKAKKASQFVLTVFVSFFVRGGRILKPLIRIPFLPRVTAKLLQYVARKYPGHVLELEAALRRCPDPVILEVKDVLDDVMSKVDAKWQQEVMRLYSTLLLGFWYRDSAYSQQADYALLELLKRADKLVPVLELRVKEPRRWYVNIGERGRKETEAMQKRGLLRQGQVADRLAPFGTGWDKVESRNRRKP